MITREADYALRVVLRLAAVPDGVSLSTTTLAHEMFIPYRFLRKIVRKLSDAGLAGSVRGKSGGIHLLERPENISVHDILAVFDPRSLLFNSCFDARECCPRQEDCKVHRMLDPVQKLLNERLQSISFADLSVK
ncbi:MAG: RrF2 family transcriptional regulator [Victivallaceae bacterium]